MKSIQNQYRDLKEGKMSQANFMRNLRMTMPQYITNVTSFNDSIKILKNKGILNEDLPGMASGMHGSKDFQNAMGIEDDSPYEKNNEDEELEDLIKKMEQEKEGEEAIMAQHDPLEESLNEGKGKDLHPNQIHPQELRMGIKVELEHTDDLDKAKKIALDHLAENPFYYTALQLSGIESPSAPKVKEPKEKKGKKKKESIQLVDLANQMKKVKMPKAEEKKKLKEARYNIIGEPNAVAKQAMQFVDGNATLKALSDDIEIQQTSDPNEALLRFRYWDALPAEAIEKLKLQFKVESDSDFDEDTGEIIFYRLTPLRRNFGSKDLGASFEKFKSQLEEVVREVLSEMQSDEQEIDNMAAAIDEYFDGRDNLADEIAAQQK